MNIGIASNEYGGITTKTDKSLEKTMLRLASATFLAALLLCAVAASGQNAADAAKANLSAAESRADMLFMLLQIQADAQGNLNDLDQDVANSAQNLSASGIEGAAARKVLRDLLDSNSNIAEAVSFDNNGMITEVDCAGCFDEGEGTNISRQSLLSMHSPENLSQLSRDLIASVLKTKSPEFSKEYRMSEGYNGTAIAYPVFTPRGELLGGIIASIVPDKLLNALVAPQLHFNTTTRSNITDYSFWAMDLDGLIAYDRDASQIGKYLFVDPLYQPYPSLIELGRKIAAERSGHGYYSFQVTEGNKKVVTKESYWTTVGLHGAELRLIVTKIAQ